MHSHDKKTARRDALKHGAQWLLGASVMWIATMPDRANAAKAAKGDFFYQDKPKDGKSCATCRLFSPSETNKGTCAVVDGEVSPNGWCMAYSPRA